MKPLLIACSILALAAATEIASSRQADAFDSTSAAAKNCQRVETNLPLIAHVWVCKGSKLPRWWSRNETDPSPEPSQGVQPAPPPLIT